MSVKAMTWLWEHSPEKSTRLLLLLAIADHCNDEGVCYPSVGRLAEKCRMTVRRAQQVIEALKQAGELGVELGGGVEANGGRTNRYYLNPYRRSIGLAPIASTPAVAIPPEEHGATPPEEAFGERGEASCTPLPEEAFGEGGETAFTIPSEEDCTTPPEGDFTIPPAKDCTQTVSNNRQLNRHAPHTPRGCPPSARAGKAPPPAVCVGERGSLEQEAFRWASEHPFWSTRITNFEALRRNLAEGKSFRAQFLAARAATGAGRSAPSALRERPQASHSPFHPAADDYHTAFWKRFGGAARGTLLDPDGGH